MRQLTAGNFEWVSDCTPDGKWLIYAGSEGKGNATQLFKISTEGGTPVEIAKDILPTIKVSPNGEEVAYMKMVGNGASSRLKFVVQDLRGTNPPMEMDAPPLSDYVGWTPDGKSLTYLVVEENARNLYVQSLRGGAPVRLIHFGEEPSLIRAYRISADGMKMAITRAKFNDKDVVMFSNFR